MSAMTLDKLSDTGLTHLWGALRRRLYAVDFESDPALCAELGTRIGAIEREMEARGVRHDI
jgi:hypothetical protein